MIDHHLIVRNHTILGSRWFLSLIVASAKTLIRQYAPLTPDAFRLQKSLLSIARYEQCWRLPPKLATHGPAYSYVSAESHALYRRTSQLIPQ